MKKKWPVWNGEKVVGILPDRHFACIVQYPGDDNWYVTPRKMPPQKKLMQLIDEGKIEVVE